MSDEKIFRLYYWQMSYLWRTNIGKRQQGHMVHAMHERKTMTDYNELKKLAEAATPGPWKLQTSCSFRRIGSNGHDGNVLRGTNNQYDGHPDLSSSEETLSFIAAANPATVLVMIAHIASQQAKIDALMLEFCPNEMTAEQIAEWARHQKPASQYMQDAIAKSSKDQQDK